MINSAGNGGALEVLRKGAAPADDVTCWQL
jgi:hypothetical protein